MTGVLITIDTELSAGLFQRGVPLCDNVASSILGRTATGDFGMHWMMDRFDAHGLTGIFFVDPMPALVYGPAFLADIVAAIVGRGHEVQLHIHTEWLAWADPPVGGLAARRNIGDYAPGDQARLIDQARRLLIAAGARDPVAFRAGNFGANDTTLRVLGELGIAYDSSYNAAIDPAVCAISLPRDAIAPRWHAGLVEMPVAALEDGAGRLRPAQLCALSAWEMRALLRHAGASVTSAQVVVTHSFEMLNRRRSRPNRALIRRFDKMCAEIAQNPALHSCGFADLDAGRVVAGAAGATPLGANPVRSIARMAEQMASNLFYDRRPGSA